MTDTVTPALSARTDRTLIRANGRSVRYVLAQVTAPTAERRRDRLPVNLAFVLDRSGSMSGAKIALARQTIVEALDHLDARDRFSIVVYDDVVDLVVESTAATADAKRDAVRRLEPIDARGSTNLGDGWLRGCEQVAAQVQADGVNRTLLLTDGLANRGLTDPEALAHHAAELRARGVTTSTFGVGTDFDEALLQRMADAGGGHFYYVHDAATIRDHITSEVGETLEIVARDVAIEVLAAEEVVVETISPHPVRAGGARSVVLVGDLVAEQAVDVVLRLTFPFGDVGRQAGAILTLRDRDAGFAPRMGPTSKPASPGRTPTMPQTTSSRAMGWSTALSRPSTPRAPGRKPCASTARVTTTVRGVRSRVSRAASATTPAPTPCCARSPATWRHRCRRWRPRCPRRVGSSSTLRARTWLEPATPLVGRSAAADSAPVCLAGARRPQPRGEATATSKRVPVAGTIRRDR